LEREVCLSRSLIAALVMTVARPCLAGPADRFVTWLAAHPEVSMVPSRPTVTPAGRHCLDGRGQLVREIASPAR
jgi:hypothetical protein